MNSYSRRKRAELDTLRISLEGEEGSAPGKVIFELLIRGNDAGIYKVPCKEIGLPTSLKALGEVNRSNEPEFSIPDHIVEKLRKAISDHTPLNSHLWLELNPPSSSLSIVPWERLLRRRLQRRLLRLSFFLTDSAIVCGDSLDMVLCASAPRSKGEISLEEAVPEAVRSILLTQKTNTTIHIFADAESYPSLKGNLKSELESEGRHKVHLYDPASAAQYPPAEQSRVIDDPRAVVNPWLVWIIDSLKGRSVDLVHFFCHGFFYSDQGSLALAQSPTLNQDKNWARFVGARQLNAFLDRVGACTVAFCSPMSNYSTIGLRLLTEQIARRRPGVSLLHDSAEDSSFADLCATYLGLYSGDPLKHLGASSVCLYCSPGILKPKPLAGSKTLAGAVRAPKVDKTNGAWISSGMRWLERTASQIDDEAVGSETQASTAEGIKESLKFVSSVLERYGLKKDFAGTEDES